MTRKTDTKTLINAMRILARDIQSDDGVANGAISEAADQMEELQAQHRKDENEYANLWQMYGDLEEECDRLREELGDSYKISVCYFPAKHEIEATWEDAEGARIMVTFSVDAEIGERLAEIIPCGAYYKATALQEDRDDK